MNVETEAMVRCTSNVSEQALYILSLHFLAFTTFDTLSSGYFKEITLRNLVTIVLSPLKIQLFIQI